MEAPRGVEPTGTNGRTRHTFRPACRVGSRPVVVSFVGWQGALFLVVTETIPVKRFCSRPLSGSRTATIGIVAWFRFCRPARRGWPLYWFCGGHGPGETPGPFPNPEAKAWHGDGTALERVWESSTPPHSTSGFPSSVTLREPFFCLLVLVSRGAREAPNPQHPCIAWSVSVTVSNDVMRLTRYARAGSRESRYDGKRQKPDN